MLRDAPSGSARLMVPPARRRRVPRLSRTLDGPLARKAGGPSRITRSPSPAAKGKTLQEYDADDLFAGPPRDVGPHAYGDAHKRLRQERGSARNFTCAHCGGRADEWAYDNDAPDELISGGLRFSPDHSHYMPLCYGCHSEFDRPKSDTCPTCGSTRTRDRQGWARCLTCRQVRRAARGETKRPGIGRPGDRARCPQGHPYDERNTALVRRADGSIKQRACRECGRLRCAARRAVLRGGDAK